MHNVYVVEIILQHLRQPYFQRSVGNVTTLVAIALFLIM